MKREPKVRCRGFHLGGKKKHVDCYWLDARAFGGKSERNFCLWLGNLGPNKEQFFFFFFQHREARLETDHGKLFYIAKEGRKVMQNQSLKRRRWSGGDGEEDEDLANDATDVSTKNNKREKKTACVLCARMRQKCYFPEGSDICQRCAKHNKRCVPRHRIDRSISKGLPEEWKETAINMSFDDALLLVSASLTDKSNSPEGIMSAAKALSEAWKKELDTEQMPEPVRWGLQSMFMQGIHDNSVSLLTAAGLASLKSNEMTVDVAGRNVKTLEDPKRVQLEIKFARDLLQSTDPTIVVLCQRGKRTVVTNSSFENHFCTMEQVQGMIQRGDHFELIQRFLDRREFHPHLVQFVRNWIRSELIPPPVDDPNALSHVFWEATSQVRFQTRNGTTHTGNLENRVQLFENGMWFMSTAVKVGNAGIGSMGVAGSSSSSSSSSSTSSIAPTLPARARQTVPLLPPHLLQGVFEPPPNRQNDPTKRDTSERP